MLVFGFVTSPGYAFSLLFPLEALAAICIILWFPPLWSHAGVSQLWLVSSSGRAIILSATLPLMIRLIGIWSVDNWVKRLYTIYENMDRDEGTEEEKEEEREEGRRIRTQLAQHTSVTVVVGAIFMIILAAYLGDYRYTDQPHLSSIITLQQQLNGNVRPGSSTTTDTVAAFINYWQDALLYITVNGTNSKNDSSTMQTVRPESLRYYDLSLSPSAPMSSNTAQTSSIYPSPSFSPEAPLALIFYSDALSSNAVISIERTALVLGAILITFVIAAFGAHSVIVPLERTVQAVNGLIADPLADLVRLNGKQQGHQHRQKQPLNETQLVSSTLMKLARLLQVGFGDAGAEIIAKNLHGDYLDP